MAERLDGVIPQASEQLRRPVPTPPHECKYEGRWEDVTRIGTSVDAMSHEVKEMGLRLLDLTKAVGEIGEKQAGTNGYLRGKAEGIRQLATTETAIRATETKAERSGVTLSNLLVFITLGLMMVMQLYDLFFRHVQAAVPPAK